MSLETSVWARNNLKVATDPAAGLFMMVFADDCGMDHIHPIIIRDYADKVLQTPKELLASLNRLRAAGLLELYYSPDKDADPDQRLIVLACAGIGFPIEYHDDGGGVWLKQGVER